jgi:hypothetical protein
MKRILFSLLLVSAFAAGAQAQSKASCAKSCAAKAASASSCHSKVAGMTAVSAEDAAAAAKLASLDATIESRKDETTGAVCYVRKETCSHSGSVSYVALNYDAATNTFVNVSPTAVNETKAAGCGSAKATSASVKSCCVAGSANKACCASKGKVATTTNANEGKPVKTAGGSN